MAAREVDCGSVDDNKRTTHLVWLLNGEESASDSLMLAYRPLPEAHVAGQIHSQVAAVEYAAQVAEQLCATAA